MKITLFSLLINIQFYYAKCDSTILLHSESENIKRFGGPANPLREARSIYAGDDYFQPKIESRIKRNAASLENSLHSQPNKQKDKDAKILKSEIGHEPIITKVK